MASAKIASALGFKNGAQGQFSPIESVQGSASHDSSGEGTVASNPKQQLPRNHLIVSPYVSETHLLDLSSVALPFQLLARALNVMAAVRKDYATAPYIEAFNWPLVIESLKQLVEQEADFRWTEHAFYIVAFRSQIPPTTDRSHLGALDKASHEEATKGGGLLKYWFGTPDGEGRNLATCVWRDPSDARRGGTGPSHKQATRETRALYTEWKIERLRLIVRDDVSSWDIVNWSD